MAKKSKKKSVTKRVVGVAKSAVRKAERAVKTMKRKKKATLAILRLASLQCASMRQYR